MMISNIINSLLSAGIVFVIVYTFLQFDETLIPIERFGLGLWGAGVLLSIAGIWAHGMLTPYSVWYQWVWRAGGLLYLGGRAHRLRRHRLNNEQQVRIARAYLADRRAGGE